MANEIVQFDMSVAQGLYSSADAFPVDFDAAWQWLGFALKGNAKKSFLKAGFIEGVDFEVFVSEDKNSDGGRPSETIRMTCEAFKQWGMMAKTEQGKQVRLYFLECEKTAKALQSRPASILDMIIASAQQLKAVEQRQSEMEQLLRESLAQKDEEIRLLKATIEVVDLESQANTAELGRFRNGHGFYFSIAGWCAKHGHKLDLGTMGLMGRKASALCKARGIQPVPVNDPRWGQVNTYPDTLLMELAW